MNEPRNEIVDCLPPRDGPWKSMHGYRTTRRRQAWVVAFVIVVGFVLWWLFGRTSS